MAFSGIGKKKVASHVLLFIFNIVSLALAAKVAKFNDFFYVADLFPLAISIVTLVVLFVMFAMEFATARSPLGLPLIEAGVLGVLSIFWLAFNAFSTSRWQYVPMQCNQISLAFAKERAWCKDVQALKAFVWITFVTCFTITIWTITYTLMQYKKGNKHVLKTPLSQFSASTPGIGSADDWFPSSSFAPTPGPEAKAYPFASGYGNGGFASGVAEVGNGGMNGGAVGVKREPSGSKYVQYEKENPFERLTPLPTPKTPRKTFAEKDATAAW